MMNGIFTEKYHISACDVDFRDMWTLRSLLAASQETANNQCVLQGAGRDELKEKCGAAFILARTYLEIYKYPKSGDEVTLTTWPKNGMRHILTRYFKISGRDGELAASIVSHWAVLDLSERKLTSPMACGIQMPDTSDVPDLLEMPKRRMCDYSGAESCVITAKYSDVDTLGHVNNTRYVSWICDMLGCEFFAGNKIDSLDIRYSHEVYAENMVILQKKEEQTDAGKIIFIRGISPDGATVHFESVILASPLEK